MKRKFFINIVILTLVFSSMSFGLKNVEAVSSCIDDDGDGICLSFIAPAGGETLIVGQKFKIEWQQEGIDQITIGYKTCESCLDWIVNNLEVNPSETYQSYEWTVPENLAGRENITIDILGYKTGSAQDHLISNAFKVASNSNSPASGNSIVVSDITDLPKSDAHKAIVKIKSFILNEDNQLAYFSSGSGVIINSNGLVLTNHHVVVAEDDFDNTEKESAYIICLTEDISKEPDCRYSGKLITSNKSIDVALLKIEAISGLGGKNSFSFLNLNSTDTTEINDEVVALGYPAIGGDTITITKGVISGKENKYNQSWLKTDAVISFGSSGGAAIDSQGGIIGITSSAHSDTLGSLGYIVSVASFNSWVSTNMNNTPRTNLLTSRTMELAKKLINFNNSNSYSNTYPVYSITKPSDWTFTVEDETIVAIDKSNDDEGGLLAIRAIRFPYTVDTGIVEASIKRELSVYLAMISIVKNEDITINGFQAKKVIISTLGEQANQYYFPSSNYLIVMSYDYGKDDKDKTIIDNIIKTFTLSPASGVAELASYSQDNPNFSLNLPTGWSLLDINSKESPVMLGYKSNKKSFADIEIMKTDDNTRNLNNDEFAAYIEQGLKEFNLVSGQLNIKSEIVKKDAHFKLNNQLTDVLLIDTVNKSISTGEILEQTRGLFIKSGDVYITPSINYFGNDSSGFNEVAGKFLEALSTFSLSLIPTAQAVVSSPAGQASFQAITIKNISLYQSLKGKIILKVEDSGKAYYLSPTKQQMFYLGRPEDAFRVMREQGVGITNINLERIPMNLNNLSGPDGDGDGLPDLFEDAIGTNKNQADSDGDGYKDKDELVSGYDPKKSGGAKKVYDSVFSASQKGKIFLQVEQNGEAWYVNPVDGKRYFLGRPADAFSVMRNLGLGISNSNFEKL